MVPSVIRRKPNRATGSIVILVGKNLPELNARANSELEIRRDAIDKFELLPGGMFRQD